MTEEWYRGGGIGGDEGNDREMVHRKDKNENRTSGFTKKEGREQEIEEIKQ